MRKWILALAAMALLISCTVTEEIDYCECRFSIYEDTSSGWILDYRSDWSTVLCEDTADFVGSGEEIKTDSFGNRVRTTRECR